MKRIVGKKAPDFKIKAVSGDSESFLDLSLKSFKGKWLVLFFYPLDFTFICPTEITSISQQFAEFEKLNACVLGVSADSVYSHQQWIRNGLGKLNFPLGADKTLEVSKEYGVLLEDEGVALRGTFIIDPDQVVKYAVVHDNNVGRNTDELLRVLTALQTNSLCGANWKIGSETIDAPETKVIKSDVSESKNSQPIKIYTIPTCSYCKQVKEFLNENNFEYEVIDLETNAQGRAFMDERKYTHLPVTVIGETEISGFRLDLIKETLFSN